MSEDTQLLEMLKGLRDVSFERKLYRTYQPGWDHDHCPACGVTLTEPTHPDLNAIHEGFATTDDYEMGAEYEWVCPACFERLRGPMGWTDATVAAD